MRIRIATLFITIYPNKFPKFAFCTLILWCAAMAPSVECLAQDEGEPLRENEVAAKPKSGGNTGEKSEKGTPKNSQKNSAAIKKANTEQIIGFTVGGENGTHASSTRKMPMRFGMTFHANDSNCTNILATIPFPMDWPEQTITVTNSDLPGNVTWQFRDHPAGARQLVMSVPAIYANDELNLIIDVEVEKSFLEPPSDPSQLKIPKGVAKELKWYLGSSPYIDIELSEIRKAAKRIADSEPENAWQHVEQIYDWVRETIEYRNGPIRNIRESLKDKKGDCEEMTGIFVAVCRASNIPARCVWIPEHCYPEFYLEDEAGIGYWFPCQAAGERQFGKMYDYRPILQKGDRFKVPEEKGMQRYISHYFSCKQRPVFPSGRDVSVEPVLDLGPLTKELEQLRLDAANGGTPGVPTESNSNPDEN